jgi:hypothetical protein
MTRTRLALALALAAAAPARAPALEWNAQLGVLYQQTDVWDPYGVHGDRPYLDLLASVAASGSLYRPGLVDWSLAGRYRRIQSSYVETSSVTDGLTFRGTLGLFNDPTSRFSLNLFGARTNDDFTNEAGQTVTGTRVTNAYGGAFSVNDRVRPILRLGLSSVDWTEHGMGRPDTERSIDTLDAQAQMGNQTYTANAGYRGSLSEGTYVTDNYHQHDVRVNARVKFGDSAQAVLTDTYYLRIPTEAAALNPRYESQSVTGGVDVFSGGTTLNQARYRYAHQLVTAPGTEDREVAAQGISDTHHSRFSEAWNLDTTLDLALTQSRLGAVEDRANGQSLSGIVRWKDRNVGREIELKGGPTIGFLEPAGGGLDFGWGGTAGAWMSFFSDAGGSAAIGYDVSFARNLGGAEGWAFRQSLTGNASGQFGGSTVRAVLSGIAERTESPLFGSGARRSLVLTADWQWRRYQLSLVANVADGLAGITPDFSGDGLLVGNYDAHSASIGVTGTAPLWDGLVAVGRFRWSNSDLPDRPSLRESYVSAGVQYFIGLLQLSVEDYYSVSGYEGSRQTQNQVILSLTRTWGGRVGR